MNTDFSDFLKQRETAASAYVPGEGAPVDALVSHQGDATFHGSTGDTVSGAKAVADRYRYLKDAKSFKPNGTSHFDVLQTGSDGDLGFWTGFQMASVQIGDMPEPIEMKLRITELFRRIEGDWKFVHRHADMGASG